MEEEDPQLREELEEAARLEDEEGKRVAAELALRRWKIRRRLQREDPDDR